MQRREEYTGKHAKLDGDSRTFDAIKTERAGTAV
jgi:hypothetical protein